MTSLSLLDGAKRMEEKKKAIKPISKESFSKRISKSKEKKKRSAAETRKLLYGSKK